ncbi:MAG: non-canonical purine NTP pyrophosphatase, RdgB/HAM1 family [SAR86 cluster bacterium]|uniref:dITP/XTP pyrophosphatase n=1 Tax=SAR86 cluster bacterium TaxID=2030880 RepID=A0A2A5CIH0_9GAMM|nr:MAG: non-canonical purine NTP pyrophosphatase, RdgB/HAM1 family [SAR86 cluster bacterium]
MIDLVLASNNKGKLKELQETLASLKLNLISQSEFDFPEAIEDGLSFVENAIIKARHAAEQTGLPAIADDSGLEVDALGGEPGIYSARYAGSNLSRQENDAANNRRVLEKLKGVPKENRSARFQCVIAFLRSADDPMPLICQGTWEGNILLEEKGGNGFGYDSIFYVPSHHCASAELSPEIKNTLSHRFQAIQDLLKRWPL